MYRTISLLLWFLWGGILVTIPFSSFPLVSKLTGRSTVSPLSILPLVGMLFLYIPIFLWKRRKLSPLWKPFIFFLLVAFLSCCVAVTRGIYPIMGQVPIDRMIRGLFTLALGTGFYFVSSHFLKSERDLRISLGTVYLGGLLVLIWASFQIYYIYIQKHIPYGFAQLHRVFSFRDLSLNRVTGFAYEPSWLADQLVILYIPLWLASVVQRFSVFTRNRTVFSVEAVLFVWSVVVLFFSFSRIGFVAFFLSVGLLIIIQLWHWSGVFIERLIARKTFVFIARIKRIVHLGIMMIILLSIIGSVIGLTLIASKYDERIEQIFKTDYYTMFRNSKNLSQTIYGLSERLRYAERVMYWEIGFRAFSEYSIMGIGLGNSGFLMEDTLPDYAYHLPELIRVYEGNVGFPNPKNIWAKLLGETGIVGFLAYVVWLLVLLAASMQLQKKAKGSLAMLGMAGMLAIFAQLIEGLSLDSFALPQLWIIVGLLTNAYTQYRKIEGKADVV